MLLVGQTISLIGTQMTGFGLGVSVYLKTDSTTLFGLITLATIGPRVLFGPLAGSLADRFDRGRVMLFGHAAAGVCSLVMLGLLAADALEVWSILLLVGLSAAFSSGIAPAFSATATLLVASEQLPRAAGMMQLGFALSNVVVPASAGYLLTSSGLFAILAIDVATFSFAIGVLLALRLPRPAPSPDAQTSSFVDDLRLVWRVLRERAGLLGLLLLLCLINLCLGMVQVLLTPLVLGFADERTLGTVLSVGGLGMVLGGGLMVTWGGPRRLIRGVIGFTTLLGAMLFWGAARPTAWLVSVGAFGVLFSAPLLIGCYSPIWQRKVELELQGRVLSVRVSSVNLALALGVLSAGPLADHLFEPLMRPDGLLAGSVGLVLGTGDGRGVALMFVMLGSLVLLAALASVLNPRVRGIEDALPDVGRPVHASAPAPESPTSTTAA